MAAAEAVDLAARPASMGKTEAKRLTGRIRKQLGDVQTRSEALAEMVRRAHADKAWAALGHASWDAYLRAEFPDLTRGQKYRLVAWGEVVGELEASTGGPVKVSGRQAAKARKRGAADVADRVRERLAGKSNPTDADRRAAVAEALADPIEATATKVGTIQFRQSEPVPVAPFPPVVLPEPAARARAAEPVPVPASTEQALGAPKAPSAGELLAALVAIEPADVSGIEAMDLDRLMSWVGLVRAAIRRKPTTSAPERPAPAKATKKAAAPLATPPQPVGKVVTTPTVPPLPPRRPQEPSKRPAAAVDPEPSECGHPPNRRLGQTCAACGATVKVGG